MNCFRELRVITPAAWLASDLAQGGAANQVEVVQDYGFDLPENTDQVAWWCPGSYVARLHTSGLYPGFTSPQPSALAALPPRLLHRRVELAPLPMLRRAELVRGQDVLFMKAADSKIPRVAAGVHQVDAFADLAYGNGMGEQSMVLLSEPVRFTREFRIFIHHNTPVAASAYLIESITWDGLDPTDLPHTRDAVAFARDAASALAGHVPAGYVLDVGLLDSGRWAVVEANPAWASNPYWATEAEAEAVVATILAAQQPGQQAHAWEPDPALLRRARHLPLRQPKAAS